MSVISLGESSDKKLLKKAKNVISMRKPKKCGLKWCNLVDAPYSDELLQQKKHQDTKTLRDDDVEESDTLKDVISIANEDTALQN
uniref:Uncharacterized protein n=1 Tax=Heterorhabditis bacteriophora TaxID=37862 RepID=A0A1I7X686_HETBA